MQCMTHYARPTFDSAFHHPILNTQKGRSKRRRHSRLLAIKLLFTLNALRQLLGIRNFPKL